jgi:hypothetical protein
MVQLDDNLGEVKGKVTSEDHARLNAVALPGRAVAYYEADFGPRQHRGYWQPWMIFCAVFLPSSSKRPRAVGSPGPYEQSCFLALHAGPPFGE